MEKWIYYSVLFLGLLLKGQASVDTLYVSKDLITTLVIGKEISFSQPASSYVVVKDAKYLGGKSILQIKARKKFRNATNYTVFSTEGDVYNFICIYNENPTSKQLVKEYDIQKEKKKVKTAKELEEARDVEVEEAKKQREKEALFQQHFFVDTIYFKAQAKKLNTHHKLYPRLHKWKVSRGKIKFYLIGTYARKDKIYIKVKIENGTSLPFDIESFDFDHDKIYFHTQSTNDGLSNVNPIYIYDLTYSSVVPNQEKYITFVFEKFSLPEKSDFTIKLKEKHGLESIDLAIEAWRINNPFPLQKHWDQKTLDMIKEMEQKEKEELKQKKKKSSKESDNSKEDIKLLSDENNK